MSQKSIEIQDVINMNYRVLTLLGIATSLIADCRNDSPNNKKYKFDWFMDAINDVVYLNKPLPPLPEKEYL